jgi:hypothetical protein
MSFLTFIQFVFFIWYNEENDEKKERKVKEYEAYVNRDGIDVFWLFNRYLRVASVSCAFEYLWRMHFLFWIPLYCFFEKIPLFLSIKYVWLG